MPMTYRTLLIDWAGTITGPLQDMMLTAAAALDLSAEEMSKAFAGLASYVSNEESIFHLAERGEVHDDELRAWVDGFSDGAGRLFDPAHPGIFSTPDRPEMLTLMGDARAAGVSVVVATNNFVSGNQMLHDRYIATGLADQIVNSADVGVRKPEEQFFVASLTAAGCSVEEAVFCDDMQRNIDAATAFGLRSVHVQADVNEAIAEIRRLLGLS